MIDTDRIENELRAMAQKFEENSRLADDNAGIVQAWGQFLENGEGDQTGPYGTCAGILVRQLAGRTVECGPDDTASLPNKWWQKWKGGDPKYRERFNQNPRLAFLLLTVRLVPSIKREYPELETEIEEELISRLLPAEKLWGDWANSDDDYDQTPSIVSTSICLLAFSLFRQSTLSETLQDVSMELEKSVAGKSHPRRLLLALSAAAVLATKGELEHPIFKRKVQKLALERRRDLSDLGIYFYDYKIPEVCEEAGSSRDYFIVPVELILIIAGFQEGAGSRLRLRAESSTETLMDNIRQRDGIFHPRRDRMKSTKNQAWAALSLHAARQDVSDPSLRARALYKLLRTRDANPRKELIVRLFAFTAILTLGYYDINVINGGWAGIVGELVGYLAVTFVAAIYGPRELGRLTGR